MITGKCIKGILLTFFSLLLVVYLGGCAASKKEMLASGAKQMGTKDLRAFFAEERTAKVYNAKKNKWYTFVYQPDGNLSILRKTKVYPRVYYIKHGKVCIKRRATSHKKECSYWLKTDDSTYYVYGIDGTLSEKQNFQ